MKSNILLNFRTSSEFPHRNISNWLRFKNTPGLFLIFWLRNSTKKLTQYPWTGRRPIYESGVRFFVLFQYGLIWGGKKYGPQMSSSVALYRIIDQMHKLIQGNKYQALCKATGTFLPKKKIVEKGIRGDITRKEINIVWGKKRGTRRNYVTHMQPQRKRPMLLICARFCITSGLKYRNSIVCRDRSLALKSTRGLTEEMLWKCHGDTLLAWTMASQFNGLQQGRK